MKKRSVGLAILLTFVTCGAYGLYWFIALTNEINEAADPKDKTSGGMAVLYSLITCGIYNIYWYYKMGKLLDTAYQKRGYGDKSYAITSILLAIFGLGLISYAIMQNGLNELPGYTYERHEEVNNVVRELPAEEAEPVAAPVAAPVVSEIKKAAITGIAGAYKNQRFEIEDGEEIVFGRDVTCCNIIIPSTETYVGRKHCSAKYIGTSDMFIVNVYSKNGVILDGKQKIEDGSTKMVKKGTVIALGTEDNQFILG